MNMDIVKRFVCGAKEAYKKVDNHSFNFPITIESAYRLATNIEKLLKEQDAQSVLSNRVCEAEPFRYVRKGFCPKCHQEMEWLFNRKYCGFCGQELKWE